MEKTKQITVETTVQAPVEKIWKLWTETAHITNWYFASDDWHAPFAENDLRAGGKFVTRMEAKDGSFGFDFDGVYDEVTLNEVITYTMSDGRQAKISFKGQENETHIIEIFDADASQPVELQQQGWQAILNNFKKYAEQTAV